MGTNHFTTSYEILKNFPSATVGGLRQSLMQISGLVELCDVGHPQKGIPVAGINQDSKHGRQEVARTFPHHLFFSITVFLEGLVCISQKKVHELPGSGLDRFSKSCS